MQRYELLESTGLPVEINKDEIELVSGGYGANLTAGAIVTAPGTTPPPRLSGVGDAAIMQPSAITTAPGTTPPPK